MSILGIDIGTTGTKAIAFNHCGEIIASSYLEYDTVFIKEGWIELDPRVVMGHAINAVKTVAKKVKKKDPVEVLGISCLGCVVIPVDRNNNYLFNGMTFMDSRSVEDFFKKIGMDENELYAITGTPVNPFFTLNKMLWMKENKADLMTEVKKLYTFKELLLLEMGIEPKIDHSLASSTMMYDLNKESWSEKIFNNIGINTGLFPEIVNSWEIIGNLSSRYADLFCLDKNVKVIAGGVDTATCPLGVGVYKPGLLSNTIGTFEEVVMLSEKTILNTSMMEKGILFSKNIIPGTFLVQGFPTTGGYVLKWFKNQFCKYEEELADKKKIEAYDLLLKDLDKVDTRMLFLPHLSGSGTPTIDEKSRGAFLKISAGSTKKEFLKSIIEGLNFEILLAIDFFAEKFGKIDEVHVTGGGTKSDAWMQIKADIFNIRIASPVINESGCLGIAVLAAYASGIYSTIEDAVKKMFKISRMYECDQEKAEYYKNKFKSYSKLYAILKIINDSDF